MAIPSAGADRMKALNKIQANMPIVNQKLENQRQAALAIQQNAALQQMQSQGQGVGGIRQAQAMGGMAAGAKAQSALETAGKTMEGQVGVAKMGLQEQGMANQAQLMERAKSLGNEMRTSEAKIAQLSLSAKKQLLDNALSFNRDARGTALLNERQLLDWKVTQAKSENELAAFKQRMELAYRRKSQLAEVAHRKIMMEMQKMSQQGINLEKNRAYMELAQANRDMQEAQAKAAADAKNKQAMYGAVGTAAGAIAGTFIAPGVGTAAGASIGGALGSGFASL